MFETSRRYGILWDMATEAEHGPIIPTLEEPYLYGSLRAETNSLTAEIGGVLIRITNGDASFRADDETVLSQLAALEEIAKA